MNIHDFTSNIVGAMALLSQEVTDRAGRPLHLHVESSATMHAFSHTLCYDNDKMSGMVAAWEKYNDNGTPKYQLYCRPMLSSEWSISLASAVHYSGILPYLHNIQKRITSQDIETGLAYVDLELIEGIR